jgi:hypothetical protein
LNRLLFELGNLSLKRCDLVFEDQLLSLHSNNALVVGQLPTAALGSVNLHVQAMVLVAQTLQIETQLFKFLLGQVLVSLL